MNGDDFKVHDITSTEQSVPTPTGTFKMVRRVTYFVGTHGPFTLEYAKQDATAARIKSDIQAEVDSLKSIHELEG